jgi:excisionase family DNA binding protein
MSNSTIHKRLLTVDEFAAATGLKSRTVRQKIWRRELEHVHIGRNVRLRAELVDELIERGTVPAVEAR